ncbi:hypothetical protein FRB96_000031 [Tulasnella sp. 330]|nr:hypothetical protein FRB96_000031 [Tulasnella sp. 330]KAG8890499.1 hypothetical protein FRB98_007846 [Tulasnella sp. 332]
MAFQSAALTVFGVLIQLLAVEATMSSLHSRQTPDTTCFAADPANTVADRLNEALNATGAVGLSIKLCADTNYNITSPIKFSYPNQEITTLGFPGLDLSHRATLTVSGSTAADGTGHTTAVDGSCGNCTSVALRYISIVGNRAGAGPITGGANIEFGGGNQNQVVEYVHSRDPRSWSCLHIAEGPFTCANVMIQNNDIGPCGTDAFQEWADGISLSCKFSTVQNNVVTGATDGGIVIFGSPGSWIHNNTIVNQGAMQLGGINLVDYLPWNGNFTGTVVENNSIMGGFATNLTNTTAEEGKNTYDAFIKIGIAMGSRTWFGDQFGYNVTSGAVVRNNTFQGAFGYAMAAAVLSNWTVTGNTVDNDVTFIGSLGPNCTKGETYPDPEPFVFNSTELTDCTMDQAFVEKDTDSLTCILPDSGDFWPWVPTVNTTTGTVPTSASPANPTSGTGSPSNSSGSKSNSVVPLAVGITFGILGAAAFALAVRWYYMRQRSTHKVLY